jgi:hypothetical protein
MFHVRLLLSGFARPRVLAVFAVLSFVLVIVLIVINVIIIIVEVSHVDVITGGGPTLGLDAIPAMPEVRTF